MDVNTVNQLPTMTAILFIIVYSVNEYFKRKDGLRSNELHEEMLEILLENKAILGVVHKRYAKNCTPEQAKMIVAITYKSTKKSVIDEVHIIKERNGVKVRREQIEENLVNFLSSRFKQDDGALALCEIDGKALSTLTKIEWMSTVADLCKDYIFDNMSKESLGSSISRLYDDFIQQMHTKITELSE